MSDRQVMGHIIHMGMAAKIQVMVISVEVIKGDRKLDAAQIKGKENAFKKFYIAILVKDRIIL